jgi:hypothetical protein
MKILHVAPESSAALVPAPLLHAIAHDVALTTVRTPGEALQFLQEHRDTAAAVIEVRAQSCAPFLEDLRALGLTTPIVVAAAFPRFDTVFAALNSGVAGYVVADASLEEVLPLTVTAAIARERGRRQIVTQALRELAVAEQQAARAEGARRQMEERAVSERAAAAAALAELGARHAAALGRETRIGIALQQRLLELEGALRKAEERRASEAVAFADQLAKRHAEFTASLAHAAHARDALAAELNALTAALDEAHQTRRSEAVAAADHLCRREAQFRTQLDQSAAERTALENALAAAEKELHDARHRAAHDLAAANERQDALEDLLAQECERRETVERTMAVALAAHEEAQRRHAEEARRAATAFAELQARYDSVVEENGDVRGALAHQTADAAAGRMALAELQARYDAASEENADIRGAMERQAAEAAAERTALGRSLDEARSVHQHEMKRADALKTELSAREADLQRVSEEYLQIRASFDRLQSAFQTLEQIAGDHAAERARLEMVVADRDSQLSAQADRLRSIEQQAHDALAEHREKLRHALAAGAAESARLQQEIDALRRELEASRTHADALRGVAERVPDLQTQLERSHNDRRRQFERAPYALCFCSPAGTITDANHSFVALLGCRRLDDLRNTDFAAAARDSAGDLGWLLERARTTGRTETVETPWNTRDGRRRIVRLQALAAAAGSIEIVAEDITAVHALEERLRRAQRLEAVGRLASEVAVTCDMLLSDAAREGREWLASVRHDAAMRRQAERLLTDLTRAAGFLRQLGIYGHEQARALDEPVSAQRVLRDLAPVLKRLVGDDIDLVLPKSAGSFPVDVESEHLERVFVNIAGYARARMPAGGQIRIDLATRAVGRRFVEKYSNVRPGDHVLVTVTELPASGDVHSDNERRSRSADTPGVDLGVLVDLIASCGGHLWLEAEPAGNTVVKIHLPKPPAAKSSDNRAGRLSRWFRAASPVRLRA